MKLKTLKDLEMVKAFEGYEFTGTDGEFKASLSSFDACKQFVKHEAIKLFKNLQSGETIYPNILDNLPEDCKGSIAKKMWFGNEAFRYGAEYGMLALLWWFNNLTEEDLK